jgi:hypothetical protein
MVIAPERYRRPTRNYSAFKGKGIPPGRGSLPAAVTFNWPIITQEIWQIPLEKVFSLQTAIFREHFHRFFRGRDSMKVNEESRR